ncbi:MAG: phosphoribosylaminoimidazolesuccinocarboxamide synthase, partial [Propionibacteriaceae bacterium]|nr:phosphoribosylaminoimidazolesuccinocarboxamide synthase [Propionibacteriaceae bacterium]
DSSRFWEAATWPHSLDSFDKQYVRNWLTRESGWDPASDTPPPALPDEVVAATRARYADAFARLTGEPFTAIASDLSGSTAPVSNDSGGTAPRA